MNFPIIDRHAAWMVVNPIQGCPGSCKYCFLQTTNETQVSPKELVEPKRVIPMIKKSKYYDDNVPICFFSHTDIFSTKANIDYLKKLLHLLNTSDLRNPIIFITKYHIPIEIIEQFHALKELGKRIIIYLSYSGLPKEIEPTINKDKIIENFINLYTYGIPILHYFRPIVPQNSSLEQIDEILKIACKYSIASVVAGIKVEAAYQSKLDFWNEVKNNKDATKKECVWPYKARERLIKIAKKYSHPIFETNSCALSYACNIADQYGFYGSDSCSCFNLCPLKQKELCKKNISKTSINKQELELTLLKNLKLLGHDVSNVEFTLTNSGISIQSIPLTLEELCHISYCLHIRVDANNQKQGHYWNVSVNNNKGMVL